LEKIVVPLARISKPIEGDPKHKTAEQSVLSSSQENIKDKKRMPIKIFFKTICIFI